MQNLIVALKRSLGKRYSDLMRRCNYLLDHYRPENDVEIMELLDVFKAMMKKDDWLYTERLSSFLNVAVRYQLAAIWALLKFAPISSENVLAAKRIMYRVELQIHLAAEELAELKGGKNCLCRQDYEMELDFFRSIIERPLAETEVRFLMRKFHPEDALEYESFMNGDPEHDVVNITPIEIAEDDILGHHGLVLSYRAGLVAVGDWYLPVIETEDKRIGVPIESFLAEIGGCPRGYIYDPSRNEFSGYNFQERRCQCGCRTFCQGGDLLFAWTPQALAAILREVKMQIGLYGLTALGFDQKLLEKKPVHK